MAHGQASERLKELQRLVDADNEALSREFQGPSDTSVLPESRPAALRVSGTGARPPRLSDRLRGLRVRSWAAQTTSPLCAGCSRSADMRVTVQQHLPTSWLTWAIVLAAASASILLLWLLFGADVTQKYIAPVLPSYAGSHPLTAR